MIQIVRIQNMGSFTKILAKSISKVRTKKGPHIDIKERFILMATLGMIYISNSWITCEVWKLTLQKRNEESAQLMVWIINDWIDLDRMIENVLFIDVLYTFLSTEFPNIDVFYLKTSDERHNLRFFSFHFMVFGVVTVSSTDFIVHWVCILRWMQWA